MPSFASAKAIRTAPAANDGVQEIISMSSALAENLHQSILNGEFTVGSALPTERELMSKYQVSRATVREALRSLRAQDLIEVRRGRSGGSFILGPSPTSLVRSLKQLISGQGFRFIDIVFAREAIEPAAAVQAAMYRTDAALEQLHELCVECEQAVLNGADFEHANLRWHLGLAEASGNPLFIAFLTAISTAFHTATSFEEFDLPTRKSVVGIHWQIYAAIRDRDPEAARRRAARHLGAYREQLAEITEQTAPVA